MWIGIFILNILKNKIYTQNMHAYRYVMLNHALFKAWQTHIINNEGVMAF